MTKFLLFLDAGVVAVFYQAFFDESGTHAGSPIMTIGAYVFTKQKARLFTEQWSRKLKFFGISHAHMTDCATGNGEYSDLSMEQRIQTGVELIHAIRKNSLSGCAISIDAEYYSAAMKQGTHVYGPYTYLLLQSVDRISRFIAEKDKNAKINYFFESGHQSSAEAHRFMSSIETYGGVVGDNYNGHAFVEKHAFLPLQAADMLAWQYRHFLVRGSQGHKPRKDFLALIQENDYYSDVSKDKIKWLADLIKHVDPLKTRGPYDLLERVNKHLLANGFAV